jgi:glycosyltransferase involved in cell wall biosynthesis
MKDLDNKKIKIVYLLPQLFGGGAERLVVDLAIHLPKDQYIVTIVCLKSSSTPIWQDELISAGIKLVQLNKKIKLDPTCLWRLVAWLKNNRPDILYTHLFGADFYGRLAGRLVGISHIISTEHNINFSEGWLKRQFKTMTAPLAERVVAVSQTVLEYAQKYEGVSKKQGQVIYNGVPLDKFINYQTTNNSVQDTKQLIMVGSMGRLNKQKNWSVVIAAAQYLPDDIIVNIAGIGPQKKRLQQMIDNLGVAKRVKLIGWQSNTVEFLKKLDIFVLPSFWEGLPVCLLEAGASSLPVIVSDIASNQEVIIDQETGLLFDPNNSQELADKIILLARQPQLAKQLAGQLNCLVKQKFSFAQMLENYQQLYCQLVN